MKDNFKSNWYPLDNAGKLYPSIMSWRVSTLFRISVTLTETVDKDILQNALSKIINRFPYFQVNLRPGLFWYYFDYTENIPKVEEEIYYPCMCLKLKKKNQFPFRVLYYNKKISVEFSHSITDGTGGIIFLQSLLKEYFKEKNIFSSEPKNDFFNYSDYPKAEEFEDSFKKHYNKNIPVPNKLPKAFHFPVNLENKGVYHIVTGIIPVRDILSISKKFNVTLTEFLIAVYFETILDYIEILKIEHPNLKLNPIVLNVPVNLRNLYNSSTLRNFFTTVTPNIDPRLSKYSFEEILAYVHNYMNYKVNRRFIDQYISKNIKSELSILNRITPLFIKNLVLPFAYSRLAEGSYTSGLSNLGKISVPKELEPYIERFEAYPPPSEGNKIKIVTISYKDNLYITFGKLTTDKNIERIFFSKLKKMGLNIKIETNDTF
ncbi:hypothetical protein [Clostridium ihumii]|uniref:hypothetical protein n=1 Tax=Clostridium ihumii TaxID=1470356 RepID=UPI003D330961